MDPEGSGLNTPPSAPESPSTSTQGTSNASTSAAQSVPDLPGGQRSPAPIRKNDELAVREEVAELRPRAGRFSRWRSLKSAGKVVTDADSKRLGLQETGICNQEAEERGPASLVRQARSAEDGEQAQVPTLQADCEHPEQAEGAVDPRASATGHSIPLLQTSLSPPKQVSTIISSTIVHGMRPGPPLWLLEETPSGILSYRPSRPRTLSGWQDGSGSPMASTESSSLSEEDSRRGGGVRPGTPSNYGSSPSNYSSRESSPSTRSVDKGHRPQAGGIGPLFRGRKSQRQSVSASWNGWDREALHPCENDSSPECSASTIGEAQAQGPLLRGAIYSSADGGMARLPQEGEAGEDRTAQQGGWFIQPTADTRQFSTDSSARGTAPLHGPLVQATPRQVSTTSWVQTKAWSLNRWLLCCTL